MQGEELKAKRKALGMSQQQLADAIGMSRKAIGEMERGDAPIEKRTGMAVRLLATEQTQAKPCGADSWWVLAADWLFKNGFDNAASAMVANGRRMMRNGDV